MTDREIVNSLIDAWEALPGGRRYSAGEIDKWLREKMAPAVRKARDEIGRQHPRPP